MVDKMKELWGKVLEWWNKFTSKQKTIIVGVASAVVFAFAILIWVLSQPKYIELQQCENTKQASEIVELLDGADIPYQTTQDGLLVRVQEKDMASARFALAAAGIPATGMSINDVTNGGFSTTESDKQKLYVEFRSSDLEELIETLDAVKKAEVRLSIPEQDGTLISSKEEASATIFLELAGDFTEENAAYVARAVATSLGNATTNNITILDTASNLLFSGSSEMSVGGLASSQLTARQQQEGQVINSVKRVLLGTGQFNSVEVACSLDIDFSATSSETQKYSAQDGRTEGLLDEETLYSSESTGNNGGIPGTDSNESDAGPSYQYKDYSNSSSSESEEYRKYMPDSYHESSETPPGKVNFAKSSATITAINYHVVKEEDVKKQGLLDGLSWDEYKLANAEAQKILVDEEFYNAVATATGMNRENITIMAYSRNEFIDAEGMALSGADIVSIILIILILALLGFVVIRSMQSKKTVEPEEELSVEQLLQSTPETEIEDISLESKSETRKMIEKFVDENPEAAANLLRNWLNEDWGKHTMARGTEEKISGLQKAAILLIALGPERSAGVFKHLKEEEIEELTLEIANTRSVTPQIKEEVINEFFEVCLAQQYIAEGGIGYAKELLEHALGSDKAVEVIGKLTASLQVKPFEFVRKTDASQLLNFIQDEHPQTIALILSYLSSQQAAMIISALAPDRQADVARRIATMDRTSPDIIKEVEKVLESKLSSLVNQDYTIIGGVDAVVDILNTVDRGTEKHIMETLEIEEPELADEIRKKMFVFEDILLLDDRAIQRVLRDVDNNDLAIALKSANEQVQNAIFNNLSKRLAVMIKEDMEFMGPVRMKDVEEAQQKIVNIIRKLEDSAEIVISRGGGDEIVV